MKIQLLKMKTMKTIRLFTLFALGTILLSSCSDDDENPELVNEEETITTIIVTLSGGMNGDIILRSQDLDGDGPDAPVVTVSNDLEGNITYTGTIQFLNETEEPIDDITEEVQEEDDEHQVIYSSTGSIGNVTTTDVDGDGNPLGLNFELATNTAGPASLTVTLRHEPNKPNDGTLAGAGGETDATATFDLLITN